MGEKVKFGEMLAILKSSLVNVPEHRTGSNTQYQIKGCF